MLKHELMTAHTSQQAWHATGNIQQLLSAVADVVRHAIPLQGIGVRKHEANQGFLMCIGVPVNFGQCDCSTCEADKVVTSMMH